MAHGVERSRFLLPGLTAVACATWLIASRQDVRDDSNLLLVQFLHPDRDVDTQDRFAFD